MTPKEREVVNKKKIEENLKEFENIQRQRIENVEKRKKEKDKTANYTLVIFVGILVLLLLGYIFFPDFMS